MIRFSLLLSALLLLSACDSPSPQFMGSRHRDVVVDGTRFAVWWSDDAAEIIRLSPEVLPRKSVVMSKAERAVVLATGCRVREGALAGDAALLRAALDCD